MAFVGMIKDIPKSRHERRADAAKDRKSAKGKRG